MRVLLAGCGPVGIAMLNARLHMDGPDGLPLRWMAVNDAADRVDARWRGRWNAVVACDRIAGWKVPEGAALVQEAAARDVSISGYGLARPSRDGDVCYRQMRRVDADWRAPRQWWREQQRLVHGMLSGVTALHYAWTMGATAIEAYGFDGGPGPTALEEFWHGWLEMREMAGLLGMTVRWHPDPFGGG